jgi:RNA recognition motif-containing protein
MQTENVEVYRSKIMPENQRHVSTGTNSSSRILRKNRMNIYVGNLPYSIDRDELRGIFEQYGEVSAASVVSDRETGRSKGFGFVEMPDAAQAQAAIEALNGTEIGGRKAVINEARPREERPPRR